MGWTCTSVAPRYTGFILAETRYALVPVAATTSRMRGQRRRRIWRYLRRSVPFASSMGGVALLDGLDLGAVRDNEHPLIVGLPYDERTFVVDRKTTRLNSSQGEIASACSSIRK